MKGRSLAFTPSPRSLLGEMLKAGEKAVAPARARISVSVTSSVSEPTVREAGGAVDVLSRSISDGTTPFGLVHARDAGEEDGGDVLTPTEAEARGRRWSARSRPGRAPGSGRPARASGRWPRTGRRSPAGEPLNLSFCPTGMTTSLTSGMPSRATCTQPPLWLSVPGLLDAQHPLRPPVGRGPHADGLLVALGQAAPSGSGGRCCGRCSRPRSPCPARRAAGSGGRG